MVSLIFEAQFITDFPGQPVCPPIGLVVVDVGSIGVLCDPHDSAFLHLGRQRILEHAVKELRLRWLQIEEK